MQHLILTRLAVGRPSDEWLKYRMAIFEKFCAPCLAAQSNRNFKWLLAITHQTPGWFIGRVGQWLAPCNAVLVYAGENQEVFINWAPLVTKYLTDGRLLTSRLDSDDMYHRDFVDTVQQAAEKSENDVILDFPTGYQLRYEDLKCRRVTQLKPTHFISRIENSRQTVFGCGDHTRVHNKFKVLKDRTNPMWVEICHQRNICVKFCDHGRIFPWSDIQGQFIGPKELSRAEYSGSRLVRRIR